MIPEGESNKIINIAIKYTQEGAQDVAQNQVLMGKAADDFYKQQHASWDTLGKDFEDFQKNYSTGTQQNVANTKSLTDQLKQQESAFHSLRMAGFELGQVSRIAMIAGAALTAGIALDANNYVKSVGMISGTASQWLGYENQIKQANLEIGQTAASVMLPTMQATATIFKDIADIVQRNPWMIQGALVAGGILGAVGTLGFIATEIMRSVADLGLIITKMGFSLAGGMASGTGEAAAGGAAAAGGVGALGVGALIIGSIVAQLGLLWGALKLGNEAGKALEAELVKLFPGLKELATQFDNTKDSILRLLEALPGIGGFVKSVYGDVGQAPTTTSQFGMVGGQMITQQEVQEFINYQKQMADAQSNYSQARLDTIKQYEQQIADSTQQYEQQRSDIVANFGRQMAQEAEQFQLSQSRAEQAYQTQRAKTIEQYNLSATRAEQQHQIEMQRMLLEHNMKINDLAAARDALGIVKENQRFAIDSQQKNQDFNIQRQQARQNLQIQLRDQQQAYDVQRAQALQDYQMRIAQQQQQEADQLARLDAQHKMEMEKLAAQEKDKLQKLDEAYKKEMDVLQQAFIDRLRALDPFILGDAAAFQSYLQREAQQFQAWIANFQAKSAASAPTLSGAVGSAGGLIFAHASGGYAPFGLYRLGDSPAGGPGGPEYVMNAATTRAAESILGGRLSQNALLQSMISGRGGQAGGGGSMVINVQSRSLTMTEIRNEIAMAMDQRLSDLLPAFGA